MTVARALAPLGLLLAPAVLLVAQDIEVVRNRIEPDWKTWTTDIKAKVTDYRDQVFAKLGEFHDAGIATELANLGEILEDLEARLNNGRQPRCEYTAAIAGCPVGGTARRSRS